MPEKWPQQVKDLIAAAWAADPKQRPTMPELVRRLREVQGDPDVLTGLMYPRGQEAEKKKGAAKAGGGGGGGDKSKGCCVIS